MNQYLQQWQQIQTAFINKRLPQSLLLVGPFQNKLNEFVLKMMQLLVCTEALNAPCGSCADCAMVGRKEHPDDQWLKAEKTGSSIKIDQIRALQNTVYLTPQRANFRVIAIEAADRMNTASANALLKILEEPPKHIIFLLLAEQIGSMLPTVLSRCQRMIFSGMEGDAQTNLLLLGSHYPVDSPRSLVMSEAEIILESLIALLEHKQHPCILAAQWGRFELAALLWFLYLVYAQLQYMHSGSCTITNPAADQLIQLARLLDPVMLLTQIGQINTLLKKINHNINLNQTLALEDLLFSLL